MVERPEITEVFQEGHKNTLSSASITSINLWVYQIKRIKQVGLLTAVSSRLKLPSIHRKFIHSFMLFQMFSVRRQSDIQVFNIQELFVFLIDRHHYSANNVVTMRVLYCTTTIL